MILLIIFPLMKHSLIALFTLCTLICFGQKQAYVIYNSKGKKVSYEKMLKSLTDQEAVLFGEFHDNPIAHWLELELAKDLNEMAPIVLGAEMIEADNQEVLNSYLNGEIDAEALDTLARLWPNYDTDYAPLVDFAKDNDLPFIATNIPRRFANMVYKQGFGVLDSLSEEEKSWMAPLPIAFDPDLPTYIEILEMMGPHGSPKLVMAQATKDATMAHFISQNMVEGKLFLHFNGAFHSNKYEGILWYLLQENSALRYSTIATVSQLDVNKLEKDNKALATFTICVDEDMTSTY